MEQAKQTEQPITLIRGLPAVEEKPEWPSFIQQYNHLETAALQNLLLTSELVIVRSGYTSLMELMQLQIKAVLVPTPGQTEQEYLADILQAKGYAIQMKQENFDLIKAIANSSSYSYRFPELILFDTEKLKSLIAFIPSHHKLKK